MEDNLSTYAIFLLFPIIGAFLGYKLPSLYDRLSKELRGEGDEGEEEDYEYSLEDFQFHPHDRVDEDYEFPDEEILKPLYEHSSKRLDDQIERIDKMSDRSFDIIKLNLTIVAAVVAVIRLGQPEIDFALTNPGTWPLYTGLLYFIIGVCYLLIRKEHVPLTRGFGEKDINDIIDGEYTRNYFHEWAIKAGFWEWIPELKEARERQSKMIRRSYWIITNGLVLVTTGIILTAI